MKYPYYITIKLLQDEKKLPNRKTYKLYVETSRIEMIY